MVGDITGDDDNDDDDDDDDNYRGEKLIGKIPETGYLTNKKWHLNEVFARV